MNETAELLLQKLDELTPQAVELFTRMANLRLTQIYIALTIQCVITIIFTIAAIVLIKMGMFNNVSTYNNDTKKNLGSIGIAMSGVAFVFACIAICTIYHAIGASIDPVASYMIEIIGK